MIDLVLALCLSLLGAVIADGLAQPYAPRAGLFHRSAAGIAIVMLLGAMMFGVFLALSGNAMLAVILTVATNAVLVIGSNAKHRVLGEPLLFSDLALIGAMLRHPQFYFSVLALWQQAAGLVGMAALVAVLVWLIEPSVRTALAGAGIAIAAIALFAIGLWRGALAKLAVAPGVDADVRAHGLLPTVLLYWLRWREARAALAALPHVNEAWDVSDDAPPASGTRFAASGFAEPPPAGGCVSGSEIIVVVQCESFADPVELFGQESACLPELGRARADSAQWGNLLVSGFGAYTMRTEFGVLFGREEEDLGFLLYDPYLTALQDPAPALPQKLKRLGWQSLFVHPHDMRFYSRDKILPKAGFAGWVGEDQFAKPAPGAARYVSDAQVAAKILDLARGAITPTLLYAVTMENHGPWAPHGDAGVFSMVDSYKRLVRAGDAMLGQLRDGLNELGRPATLVFFGDHRPTIPGASDPGGDKHTPYVILRCGNHEASAPDKSQRRDLTPAQLHKAIIDWGLGGQREY